MNDLHAMSEVELLQTHGAVIAELRRRGVVKTNNNPIGDYTEWLVCHRLGLKVQGNSQSAFDAVDHQDVRYQIKGRCSDDNSVQFSPIRNLDQHGFDYLIAVLFGGDYSVRLAVKVSYEAVHKLARYQAHINGYSPILTRRVVEQDGVEDITHMLA